MIECNPSDSARFLRQLFGHYSTGWIEIRSMNKVTGAIKRDWYQLPYDLVGDRLNAIAQHCASMAYRKFDVYVGVCPRVEPSGPGRKSGRDAVAEAGVVWVDVDRKVNGATIELLDSFDIIVESGNGWHAYRRLEKLRPMKFERDRKEFEAQLKTFANHTLIGLDNVANVDRILRVAGTLNWKNTADPKPVQLLKCAGLKAMNAPSRWKPWFDNPRLDALLVSAENGKLGRATPRIKIPSGRHIDDLDCAVVGLFTNMQRAKTNPFWEFAVEMAREDLPYILDYFDGRNENG